MPVWACGCGCSATDTARIPSVNAQCAIAHFEIAQSYCLKFVTLLQLPSGKRLLMRNNGHVLAEA